MTLCKLMSLAGGLSEGALTLHGIVRARPSLILACSSPPPTSRRDDDGPSLRQDLLLYSVYLYCSIQECNKARSSRRPSPRKHVQLSSTEAALHLSCERPLHLWYAALRILLRRTGCLELLGPISSSSSSHSIRFHGAPSELSGTWPCVSVLPGPYCANPAYYPAT